MLPLCERVLHTSRMDFLPCRHRGSPVPTKPKTIGQHLVRRRVQLGLHQSQAARLLEISTVTLSRWELDKIFPPEPYHDQIILYLRCDPFEQGAKRHLETPKATNP
jgi:DNA-binding XRE family transcriptional regulator